MQNRQLDCYLEDVNGKVVVLVGDEWDSTTISSLKENFKRKGVDILGLMVMPDIQHAVIAKEKEDLINNLKKVIKHLESL